MTIIIKLYDSQWEVEFKALRKLYYKHLSNFILDIQHVGSTSVKGLCAKPVLDIDVIIKNPSMLGNIIPVLQSLGYRFEGDLGIIGREAFARTSEHTPLDSDRKSWMNHHLYVCIEGSIGLENHLKFRNYLRKNPVAKNEYGKLKLQLADKYSDNMDLYTAGKTSFITAILAKVGMQTDQLQIVKKQNLASESLAEN